MDLTEIQKTLDGNSAQHVRFQADIITLQRFVAQLYENCSNGTHKAEGILEQLVRASDHEEQRLLEFAETKMPSATARIDAYRPVLDTEDAPPPVW